MKLVEFLYFYLMPETPSANNNNGDSNPRAAAERMQRSPSKQLGRSVHSTGNGEAGKTRTMEEKQSLLGKYLNNVEDLVDDLRETAPFGAILT
jgi:hypothetical protein